MGSGELVVFGSGALAFWLTDAPHSRDVDVFCVPAERGDAITALMGELSWYHDRHAAYVEVWGPETFAGPTDWRERAKSLRLDDAPEVEIRVPHPHDLLISKLERMEARDRDHARRILAEWPLTEAELDRLLLTSPQRHPAFPDAERRLRFEHGLEHLRSLLSRA